MTQPKFTGKHEVYIYCALIFGIVSFVLLISYLITNVPKNTDVYITRDICENNWCERIEVNDLRFYNEYIVDCDDDPKTINCLEDGCCHYEKRVRQIFKKDEVDRVILNNQCECAYDCLVLDGSGQRREECISCNHYVCGDYNVEIR